MKKIKTVKEVDELAKLISIETSGKDKVNSYSIADLVIRLGYHRSPRKEEPEGMEGHTCYLGAGSEKCPMCNPDKEAEAECHNPACPCPNHDLPLKPAQAGLSVEEIYQALLPIPSVHVPISQMNGKTYHYMCKYDIATAIFEAINRGS